MKLRYCVLVLSILLLSFSGFAAGHSAGELAGQAASADAAASTAAIRELRSMGYAGLDAI